MKRVQLTKNLCLHEYIPEDLYNKYIDKKPHYLIGLIDPRLPIIDQFLRDRFGKVTINNKLVGGDRNWSGLRTSDSSYYSFTSQHSWGRSSDKIFHSVTAEEVRQDIKDNYEELYKPLGLSCIEDGTSWLHSDCRYHQFPGYKNTGLLIVPIP